MMWRNKEREPEAEDVGVGSRSGSNDGGGNNALVGTWTRQYDNVLLALNLIDYEEDCHLSSGVFTKYSK